MNPKLLGCAVAATCLVLAAASLAADTAPDWVVRASRTSVPTTITAGPPVANSVILWKQTIITAAAGSGATKTFEREAVRILTQAGADAAIFGSYYDDDSRVDVEGAWSLHADGTAETLKSREVAAVQQANPEDFSDTFVVFFRPPRLGVGDIAAYALSRKSHRDVYQSIIPVQDARPVAAQQILVDLPAGWRHRWRLTHAPEGYSGPLSGEGGEHASFEFGPQRAIADEEMAPPAPDLPANLEVAVEPPEGTTSGHAFRSWSDVGSWSFKRTAAGRQDAPFVGLPASSPDPVRLTAAWVQDHIRYVAIEAGEGGYVPRPPALVVKRLYGDCKDKAFLMLSLLRRYQINGLPVATQARSFGAVDRDFPTVIAFNHVIVAIPEAAPTGLPAEVRLASGPAVIFDPTDPATPYGQLRGDLQGARGLVFGEAGSELVDFPYAPMQQNSFSRTVEASVSADRSLSARVTDISLGAESRRLVYRDTSDTDRDTMLNRFAQRRIPGSRISEIAVRNLDDREQPLEVAYRLSVPNWVQRAGESAMLRLLPLPIGPDRIPDLSRRRSPVELGAPGHRELVVRFSLGAGLRPGVLPDTVDAENEYGHYRCSAALENGKIVVRELWDRKKPEIPLAAITSWQALEDASARARAKLVTLAAN